MLYKIEINKILEMCHGNCNHEGRDATLYNIKNKNYFWVNMVKDISNYIDNCDICAKVKTIIKSKREKTQKLGI